MKASTNTQNQKRDFVYSDKAQTKILLEEPSEHNAYIAKEKHLHGYNLLDLLNKKSFMEVLLLLYLGELPEQRKVKLLEKLMIGLVNLGPRHPAVKAAMVAGVSKANAEHILPIGLMALGGKGNGAKEVSAAIEFLQSNIDKNPTELAENLLSHSQLNDIEGEYHVVPGFGNQYGAMDIFANNLANSIIAQPAAPAQSVRYLTWAHEFATRLNKADMGWLTTGIAAAVFCELEIPSREAIGLFQIICAPGIFAQGVEQTHHPITAIPMLTDEQHEFTNESGEAND